MTIRNTTYWLFCLLLAGGIAACSGNLAEPDDDDDVADDDIADDDVADDDAVDDDAADDDMGDDDVEPGDDDDHPAEDGDFHLDLASATFTEPPGIGSLLAIYLADVYLVAHVSSLVQGNNSADIFMAVTDLSGGVFVQDLCDETISLSEGAFWNDPNLHVEFAEFPIAVDAYTCSIYDVEIGWTFAANGNALFDGVFEGEFDTRCLDPLIDPGAGEGAACDLLASLGIGCIPCSNSGEPFCLVMAAEAMEGARVDVVGHDPETGDEYDTLVPVTSQMVQDWTTAGFCP